MPQSALERAGNRQVEQSQRFATVRKFATTWGRAIVIALAFAIQLAVFAAALTFLARWSTVIYAVQLGLGVLVLLHILNLRMETAYKLAWAIPVLLVPVFGTAFYVLFGSWRSTRRQKEEFEAALRRATAAMDLVPAAGDLDERLLDGPICRQLTFLNTASQYTAFDGTATTYYPVGEDAFEAMLEAIEGARRYVFAEYFIVDEGVMLDRLMEVLARKAAEGLDVRFLYDDLGSFFTLPVGFQKRCTELGISAVSVNPVGLGFTLNFQNRNHRKILVVDGETAFTGGINIADEYINEKERFGHWKDTVVRLVGPGAWPFTVMFLHMWDLVTPGEVRYDPFVPRPTDPRPDVEGLVAPFDDSPFDDVSLGLDLHQQLLQSASRSVDIFTPYLIINDGLVEQLRMTAQSGIRVRIVTPHIPDKWYVHMVTRSFYRTLMEAGVEIYEYTPGFIHAKSTLVDNDVAIVGTVNFDFRSFFLHQECGVWLHHTAALEGLRRDVEDTIARSQRITDDDLTDGNIFRRLLQATLRAFAPLM